MAGFDRSGAKTRVSTALAVLLVSACASSPRPPAPVVVVPVVMMGPVVVLGPVVIVLEPPVVSPAPAAPPVPWPPDVELELDVELVCVPEPVNVDSLFLAAQPQASAATIGKDVYERIKVGQDLMGSSAKTKPALPSPVAATRTKHGSENADP